MDKQLVPPDIQVPTEQVEADDRTPLIEVIGSRRDQTVKVDRRTFQVSSNPATAQKDALELVRSLPAVTVTPEDSVNLLGSGNVTIMVDGRPYQGRAAAYLKALRGSEIERIEVITNPSAQYSAEGMGGIINFVLRRQPSRGRSGSSSLSVTSVGRVSADGVMKSKSGRVGLELQANLDGGNTGRAVIEGFRSIAAAIGSPPTINSVNGFNESSRFAGTISGKLTYDLGPRTSIAGKITGASQSDIVRATYGYEGRTPDFASFRERQRTQTDTALVTVDLTLDHKGKAKGETFGVSLQTFSNPENRYRSNSVFSNLGPLIVRRNSSLGLTRAQVDWTHPLGKNGLLSMGWVYTSSTFNQRLTVIGEERSGTDFAFSDQYGLQDRTVAFYSTLQQALGDLTLLPGIRVENYLRRISSPKNDDTIVKRSDVFPSFHVAYDIAKGADLRLSYSRRIDRPSADFVRPYRSIDRALDASVGNPELGDQTTDAYEFGMHYARKKFDADITVYIRDVHDVWTKSYRTGEDSRATAIYINAGNRLERGLQFDFSASVLDRLKTSLSANLFSSQILVSGISGNPTREVQIRYSLNSSLEWTWRERRGLPGDVLQLQWTHDSAAREYSYERLETNWINGSFTHNIRKSLSVTASISYLTPLRSRIISPLIEQRDYSGSPVEFKIRIFHTFGG